MPVIETSRFTLAFDKSLNKFSKESFIKAPREYTMFSKAMNAPAGKTYDIAQYAGLGLPRDMKEGAGVEFDEPVEGNSHTIRWSSKGLGFQWTEDMEEDILNKQMLQGLGTQLGEMMAYRLDLDWGRAFALGDGTSYLTAVDGKAQFANDHATLRSGDTIDNLAASALTDATLQVGFEKFWGGSSSNLNLSDEGLPLRINPTHLIVTPANYMKAMQLNNQSFGVVDSSVFTNAALGSSTPVANGSQQYTNALNPKSGIVSPYSVFKSDIINVLMTARGGNYTGSWWLVSKENLNLLLLWKKQARLERSGDFRTGNVLYKMTMRYGYGWDIGSFKAAYGSYTA